MNAKGKPEVKAGKIARQSIMRIVRSICLPYRESRVAVEEESGEWGYNVNVRHQMVHILDLESAAVGLLGSLDMSSKHKIRGCEIGIQITRVTKFHWVAIFVVVIIPIFSTVALKNIQDILAVKSQGVLTFE